MTTVSQKTPIVFPELSDQELITRSVAGDVAAFQEIATRYYPLIRTLAFSATGRESQSDSLARETFTRARRQLVSLGEQSKLRPWLCRIACQVIDQGLAEQFVRHYTFASRRAGAKRATCAG